MDANRIVIVGAGGHGRSVLDAVMTTGHLIPAAFTDLDTRLHGTSVDGVAVIGDDAALDEIRESGCHHAAVGVGGTHDNRPRRACFERLQLAGWTLPVVVHARAVVSDRAQLGPGSVVMAAAVVNAGVRVGLNVIINTGAIVEHDCRVGDHAHVASGAVLAGGVNVGEGAHVGCGASVRESVALGHWSVVGAGAAVIEDVDPGDVVVGVPARKRPG
jgi:sugar O-acyltransferase (sialic acid O-acetyltransferase NeuD family)